MDSPSETQAHAVKPEQLCPGLHIHLDLPWTDHPFSFPSFTLNSPEQIVAIGGLGLKKISYSPAKSTCPPLPDPLLNGPDTDSAEPPEPSASHADDAPYQAKTARIKRLAE